MAKERKQFGIVDAVNALTTAARAEANGTLTPEAKQAAINTAMDVIDNSNFVAIGEKADMAIETAIQREEQIEAEAAAREALGTEQPEE